MKSAKLRKKSDTCGITPPVMSSFMSKTLWKEI
jgi:hypothetical protein